MPAIFIMWDRFTFTFHVFKLLTSLNWQLYPEWHYSEAHYGKGAVDVLFKCRMFLCGWCIFRSLRKFRKSCHNPALISIESPIRFKEGALWLSQKCVKEAIINQGNLLLLLSLWSGFGSELMYMSLIVKSG